MKHGMAMKMSAAGYMTHFFGKWVRQSLDIPAVHIFAAAIAKKIVLNTGLVPCRTWEWQR